MKSLITVATTLLGNRTSRSNLMALMKLLGVLGVLIVVYSVTFHVLMEREGQDHSWLTGLYWTLTVMSTLGFGDITFQSDLGRLFSIVVLGTGIVFLLVLLPFTFIEFFYAPWIRAQEQSKAPRRVPADTERHVLFTRRDPVAQLLVRLLEEYGYPFFFLVPDAEEAAELRAEGLPVVLGDRSDPETYRRLAIDRAAMVVTTLDDVANTNVTFTVREVSDNIPIVASATSDGVRDALELAGVTHILRLEELMGQALARRVSGHHHAAHVIGELEDLVIAEASPINTPLCGQTIGETKLRSETGVTVVGLWQRGRVEPGTPETKIGSNSLLLLAGTREQIESYNQHFASPSPERPKVVIAGGGRVGRATGRALTERGLEWTLVEKIPERVEGIPNVVIGDVSEFETLVAAGMQDAAAAIITSHHDELNIFLTILFRRLRHSLQIISRCSHESFAPRLHRAGADLVLSYASMGANTIFNLLRGSDTVLLAEGVNIFTLGVPAALAGKTLAESNVPTRTGCSIVAVEINDQRQTNPDPDTILPADGEMVLIGSLEAERKFLDTFKPPVGPSS